MRFATRSIAAAILVLAACHDASTPVDPGAAPDLAARGSKDRSPPTAPTNLRATNVTSFSVSLAWDPATDNSGVVSYRIRLMSGPGYMVTVPSTPTSYTWTKNLAAGNDYSFLVSAVDAAGNESKFSNLLTVETPPDVIAPTAPVVSALDIGPTHLVLSWLLTDDGPFIFYSIYVDGNPVIQGTSNTEGRIGGLEPERTYTITAQARDNGINSSPMSEPVTFTTTADNVDVTPPTVPANLSAWGVGDGSGEINAFWNASTDDRTPQSLIHYTVYLNGEFVDATAGAWTRSVMYGVNRTNRIEVRAIDAAGNESAAVVVELQL
jgi:chitinase